MLTVATSKNWTPLLPLLLVGVLGLPALVPAQTRGAADVYRDKCTVCHGEDGAGKTAKGKKLKVKDVHDTVKTLTAEQMAEVVTKGKDPDMDAFGKELTPDQVKQIVAYYRDLAAK